MALNMSTSISSLQPKNISSLLPKPNKNLSKISSDTLIVRTSALSEGTERGVTQEDPPTYSGSSSSARAQLDLLEQLTSANSTDDGYDADGSFRGLTIRDQLANLVGDRDDDFSIPLGKNLKKFTPRFLTISQKRNIKRQSYLNEVSKRNDSVFFATIGGFVLLPPLVILGIAVATGYVQLFP